MLCRLLVGIQRRNVRSFFQSEHHLHGNICQSGFLAPRRQVTVLELPYPSGRGRSGVVRGCGRHLREDRALSEPPCSHPASRCQGPARRLVFPGRSHPRVCLVREGAQTQHQGPPTQPAICSRIRGAALPAASSQWNLRLHQGSAPLMPQSYLQTPPFPSPPIPHELSGQRPVWMPLGA